MLLVLRAGGGFHSQHVHPFCHFFLPLTKFYHGFIHNVCIGKEKDDVSRKKLQWEDSEDVGGYVELRRVQTLVGGSPYIIYTFSLFPRTK